MNQASSVTSESPGGLRGSAVFGWVMIVAGLLGAWGLFEGGKEFAASLPVSPPIMALVLFYAALFTPLALWGLILGLIEKRPILRLGHEPVRWAAIGLAVGVGGLCVAAAYVWLNATMVPGTDSDAFPGSTISLGLAISVLTVGTEEILFRGWLLSALQDRAGPAAAVVLSAAVFSGFHMLGGPQTPVSLVNLMLGGIWFALLAQRSGGLLAPFFAHLGWNVTEELGFGLVPESEFPSLANHDMIGSALWGGSSDGLNSSIAMTVVLVALIVPLLTIFSRSPKLRR